MAGGGLGKKTRAPSLPLRTACGMPRHWAHGITPPPKPWQLSTNPPLPQYNSDPFNSLLYFKSYWALFSRTFTRFGDVSLVLFGRTVRPTLSPSQSVRCGIHSLWIGYVMQLA
jgi:hypothetical protein